jgi:hypothetical protein
MIFLKGYFGSGILFWKSHPSSWRLLGLGRQPMVASDLEKSLDNEKGFVEKLPSDSFNIMELEATTTNLYG